MEVLSTTRQNEIVQYGLNASKLRFAVEIDGVRIPTLDRETSNIEVQNKPELVRLQKEFSQLQADLKRSIEMEVREGSSLLNAITIRQAVESYTKMSQRILNVAREWNELVALIIKIEGIDVGISTTDESKRQLKIEQKRWQLEIQTAAELTVCKSENSVTAKLASQPLSEVNATLEGEVDSKIDTICTEMLRQLTRLVDLEVIAFIEWYGDRACTYQRFTRKFEIEQVGIATTNHAMEFVGDRRRKTTTNRTFGTTSRKLRRHIQHLVRAEVYSVGHSKGLIPREQKELIKSLPSWLASSICIVEGMLIRETLVEKDLGVHTWEIKEDEVQWLHDPAIVLGPFVLSAWGPMEVQDEIEKQEREFEETRKSIEESLTGERQISPFKIAGMVILSIAELILSQITKLPFGFTAGIFLAAVASLLLALPWGVSNIAELDENQSRANRFATCYAIGMVFALALAAIALSIDHLSVAGCCLATGGILSVLYVRSSIAWDRLSDESRLV